MSYIPSIETKTLAAQKQVQVEKLKVLMTYLQVKSPFYKQMFKQHWIDVAAIHSLEDLQLLPTTSKEDIQLHNFDFLCVPLEEVAEYTTTSGTMGNPVTIALTKNDLERLAYNEYLSFEMMQLGQKDIVQFMLTLDRQFMAGMAYYMGLQKVGATCIRSGPGLPSMQIECMKRLSTTTLVAVPSFMLKLLAFSQEFNIDMSKLSIQKILCIGENIRNDHFELNILGRQISTALNVQLFSTYASTEIQTAFTECEHGRGGHAHPSLIITEILDEKGNALPAGEYGEVTITTLGVEGMPLLRYRTGDICCYFDEPCLCGRTTLRLSPVKGRKHQMIKFKGTTLYPPALFELLNHCSYIQDYVIEVKHGELETDELILHIHTLLQLNECEEKLKPFLQSSLRVVPIIYYLSNSELQNLQFPAGSRKAIRFLDRRNQQVIL